MAEPPSSPPSGDASTEDLMAWYKAQYEQLEHELIEFRESSRELEGELEKDLDAADKRERKLREKAEGLDFEVEEWKRKYKESKTEANAAQNNLEKEITKLRDSNRTLQLRLRDIEVANDDFERQARNTTSSLEDLESKYNVSIERGVLLEEEIKMGELERETLRVDAQRLREELSELKIEADIMQDKLKKHEARHLSALSTDLSTLSTDLSAESADLSVLSVLSGPASPTTLDHSPSSTASSPLITTPPDSKAQSAADGLSDIEGRTTLRVEKAPKAPKAPQTPALGRTPAPASRRSRLPSAELSASTPRPKTRTTGSSSTRVVATAATRTPGPRRSTSATKPTTTTTSNTTRSGVRTGAAAHKLPASNSLSHIRSLTAQMQRLEARVHSVRSKLPAPVITPTRVSPRNAVLGGPGMVPSSVTIRSRKRTIGSTASSVIEETTPTAGSTASTISAASAAGARTKHVPRLSTSGVSRLSFGPLPNRGAGEQESRPSSRASVSSYARPVSRSDLRDLRDQRDLREMPPPRPMSRTSLSGARTPLGRPRSSLGGSMHNHSMSISDVLEDEVDTGEYRTPSRRGTYSRYEMEALAAGVGSGIPTPTGIPIPGSRRQSGGMTGLPVARRASTSMK